MDELDYGTNRLHLCDHWDNYGMSFILPADADRVTVHGGGYNEPPVAYIPMENYIDSYEKRLFEAVCMGFHRAAEEFIEYVDTLCDINVDTVVALFQEDNLGVLPEALDNTDKFDLLVAASEIVSIANAHLRAWKADGREGKNYG